MILSKLQIWQKLAVVLALLSVPIAVLTYLFVSTKRAQVISTRAEAEALDYVRPLRGLAERLDKHRGATYAAMSGDAAMRGQASAVQSEIDNDLRKLAEVDGKLGESLGTSDLLRTISQKWGDLRAKSAFSGGDARDAFESHTLLIADAQELLKRVGDRSGLTTDPELDTHYLANTALFALSDATDTLGQLRGFGTGVIARGRMTAEEQAQLVFLARTVQADSNLVRRNMREAFARNKELESKLNPQVATVAEATSRFVKLANDRLIRVGTPTVGTREYFDAGSAALDQQFGLYDRTLESAETLLKARISRLGTEQTAQLGLAFVILLASVAVVYLVSNSIAKQVGSLKGVFNRIGVGDFTARTEIHGEDELGQIGIGLNQMLDNTTALIQSRSERDRIQESIQRLLEEMAGVAEGDLTTEAEVTAEMTGAIADSFNYMILELRRIISKVQDTTLQVSAAASQVQTTAEELAMGSESQAVQIGEASAAIDEMTLSIQQVSTNANSASSVAEQALRNAKQGAESVQKTIQGMNAIRQQVQQTAKRMKRLGESSQEIGEIVQLIDDIADRTSILALNASIQAAMAGEAGKGFAVVAEEVERLAERSTDATKRISTLIKSIQSDTNEAISAMEETTREVVAGSNLAVEAGQTLNSIESVSNQLADLIQQISMASRQQSRGSESVSRSMGDISGVTQKTANGAKQAATAIRQLAQLADELRGSLTRFKLPKEERMARGAAA